jgi:hypothetical protein
VIDIHYKMRAIARFGRRAFIMLWVCLATGIAAQDAPETPEAAVRELPTERHLAAALSDASSRQDTLLTMLAVARLLDYGYGVDSSQLEALATRFREERAWLDRLASRYAYLPMRGSLMDPTSWHLQLRLDSRGLVPGHNESPTGPDTLSLLQQLFDRGDERLAAAVLPEILPRVELLSTGFWSEFRYTAGSNPPFGALADSLASDWFDPWMAAEPPAPSGGDAGESIIDEALELLAAIVEGTSQPGPPDEWRLKRLRFLLLTALPNLGAGEAADAEHLLLLGGAVDGLNEGRFLGFSETLLWVASTMLFAEDLPPGAPAPAGPQESRDPVPDALEESEESPEAGLQQIEIEEALVDAEIDSVADPLTDEEALPPEEYRSPLPRALSEWLPVLSDAYAGAFSEVDPRINASLAAAFDIAQYLQGTNRDRQRMLDLRSAMADAVAQMVLLIPDMGFYFDQPVRNRIVGQVESCISFIADKDESGRPTLTREQYDDCLSDLVELSGEMAREAELAGDPDGPYGVEQMRRELLMTPWQRINYTLGYLHEQEAGSCEPPGDPLPNPLEWSTLATVFSWFARQSPVYFQTPENEELLREMRAQGLELTESLLMQVDCISGVGAGVNDPVVRSLADYRRALESLIAGLREAELDYRAGILKPGSDVVLHRGADQATAFRTEGLTIGPCDEARICEMTGELEATRALIGLFPDIYLIADQSGLGGVEICYDNVRWVNRRTEQVRADDTNVANYFGQLSFELVGRYRESGQLTEVFGFTFVSPSEYHYLFGAATEEILADSCPMEWVGSRIVTRLPGNAPIWVVPDRLTYLTAARSLPSRVINSNWSRNEEWRDSFITGLNVTPYLYPGDPGISTRVEQHLQSLHRAEQNELYGALMRPMTGRSRNSIDSLFERLEEVNVRKSLVRGSTLLFYPGVMTGSDDIRGSILGYSGLLDRSLLRRIRESGMAVSAINEVGTARLERLHAQWDRQPENLRRSGSVASSLAHAMARLNALHRMYFSRPESPVERPPEEDTGASVNLPVFGNG